MPARADALPHSNHYPKAKRLSHRNDGLNPETDRSTSFANRTDHHSTTGGGDHRHQYASSNTRSDRCANSDQSAGKHAKTQHFHASPLHRR